MSGILMLLGFILAAILMATKRLSTLLAMPLLAAWLSLAAGAGIRDYLNYILLNGSALMASDMAVVILGATFVRVMMRTGISSSIIRNSAELAGEQPFAIAFSIWILIALIFMGMMGLGAVIMTATMALPLLTGAGIEPVNSVCIILLAFCTGMGLNTLALTSYSAIFGAAAVESYMLPYAVICASLTVVFLLRNICDFRHESMSTLFKDILMDIPRSILSMGRLALIALNIIKSNSEKLAEESAHIIKENIQGKGIRTQRNIVASNGLVQRTKSVSIFSYLTPIIPLIVVLICKETIGFNVLFNGVSARSAIILGFIIAAIYAIIITKPREFGNIMTASILEGIQDVAGVIFLFIGIGMLASAIALPVVKEALGAIAQMLMPSSGWGVFAIFAIFAPAALYRGPLNLYGMGAGLATMMLSLNILPAEVLCGLFLGVQYIQMMCDPTNSHNTWLAGYAHVSVTAIMQRLLPYAWLMCIIMLVYVFIMRW